MKLNILVSGGLHDSQAGYSAWEFCRAALAQGHDITQVFFYQQGVSQATQLAVPLTDEFDATEAWATLSSEADIPLVVCVSAAERRGVLNEEQRLEAEKAVSNLHAGFEIAGLGSLHEASLASDRTVSFR
ncbi:MAG: sulfurtransferase complex subunit TusD [Pseudomonadota bacterium]